MTPTNRILILLTRRRSKWRKPTMGFFLLRLLVLPSTSLSFASRQQGLAKVENEAGCLRRSFFCVQEVNWPGLLKEEMEGE